LNGIGLSKGVITKKHSEINMTMVWNVQSKKNDNVLSYKVNEFRAWKQSQILLRPID